MGQRHAVRPAHRGVTTGQWNVREMSEPGEAVVVRQQELPAPYGAVVSVAGAVEGDADHLPGAVQSVLGHGGRDVRVMVLDPYDGPVRRVPVGPSGGAVAGMPVGDQGLGAHPGNGLQLRHRALENPLCSDVVHVADVPRQPGLPTHPEAEGVLQVSADGEGRPHGQREGDRQRGVAT